MGKHVAKKYFRVVDLDERGHYAAHVEDENGKDVFEYTNEDEDGQSGPLWLVEDGFMRHPDDLDGLEKYLKSVKLMPDGATLRDAGEMDLRGNPSRRNGNASASSAKKAAPDLLECCYRSYALLTNGVQGSEENPESLRTALIKAIRKAGDRHFPN